MASQFNAELEAYDAKRFDLDAASAAVAGV